MKNQKVILKNENLIKKEIWRHNLEYWLSRDVYSLRMYIDEFENVSFKSVKGCEVIGYNDDKDYYVIYYLGCESDESVLNQFPHNLDDYLGQDEIDEILEATRTESGDEIDYEDYEAMCRYLAKHRLPVINELILKYTDNEEPEEYLNDVYERFLDKCDIIL